MIERTHLAIIEALDRTGSLTGAARELNLTQSALTHSIKKLESLTGAVFWEKEGRALRLTESGKYLLQSARKLLPHFSDLENRLAAYASGKRGSLIIGVECHPCFEWLVQSLRIYLDRWPRVELEITRNFQFDGLDALVNHKVNMLVSPDHLPHEAVEHYDILDFELQLMVPEEHRLASVDFVRPEDLNGEVLYTYPVDKSRLDIFKLPIRPEKHMTVESAELMVQLVAAGRGVTAFPDWLIKKFSADSPVKGVPLTERGISKKLFLIIRKEDRAVPYIKGFVDLLSC